MCKVSLTRPKIPGSKIALGLENFVGANTKSKTLDMGKGCVRFNSLGDLALGVVGRTVARVSAEEHMANYRAARARKVK